MTLPELRPRQPFSGLALAAVLGIFAADRWPANPLWWLIPAAFAGVVVCLRPRAVTCWILTALAFGGIHTMSFHGHAARALQRELSGGPRVVQATGLVWSQPEPLRTWSRHQTGSFRFKVEQLEPAGQSRAEGLLLTVNWAGPLPSYGDRVILTGSAHNLEPNRNPGQFDFTQHFRRQGIYSEIDVRFATDARVESRGHGHALKSFANATQSWIKSRLVLGLEDSPEITSLITSMVLGLRGETPAETKELFQRTGTLHLFAVSGLNVAMLAAIVIGILKPMRITGSGAVAVTLPILIFYAIVTGLSASCVRATIMGSLLLLGPVVDRRTVSYNSLSAAAFLILAWDSNQLFSPGFQFSFVLVFTIVFLANRIARRFEPLGRPDVFLPRLLWNRAQRWGAIAAQVIALSLGVTLSAWLGSLVFTAGYFHLFSPASIFANLLAVPLAFCVLALGVAALLCGICPPLAALFNHANWCAAKLLLLVVKGFASIPGGHVYVELPSFRTAPACELQILDVGEGGAIHLRSGQRDWLIDCGSQFHYEHIVLPYLRTRGVNRLAGLLLTHGDSHHLGGSITALDDFHPEQIFDSPLRDRSPFRKKLHAELQSRSLGKALARRGDWIRLTPEISLRVLFPPSGWSKTAADDKALVLQLQTGSTRVLFMSDSGFTTEQWLLANEPDLRSDLLVKSRHARDLSGTLDFVTRVAPGAVICGRAPLGTATETLELWEQELTARGIVVFRQERTGAVAVKLQRDAWEARAFVGDQIFRSRAR